MSSRPTKANLIAAVKSLRKADTEYRRAIAAAEQPRLSKAGTRYAIAKISLFHLVGARP